MDLLPRYPSRQGDKQFTHDIEDVLNAMKILDEQKSLNKLPVFVTHDTSKIPPKPLEDGEYICLLNKMDKLEDVVVELKAMIFNMLGVMNKQACTIQPSSVVNNHPGVHSNFDASIHDQLSWPPLTRPPDSC